MNSSEKKLSSLLAGGADQAVLKALDDIKKDATAEMVPALIERWRKTDNIELASRLYHLMIDIKDQKAVPFFIEALRSDERDGKQVELLAALWQAGFDLSPHLEALMDIALSGDYMTVLEVSTIVENMDQPVPEDVLGDSLYRIQEIMDQCEDEDLVNLLENLKELVNQLYTNG